MPTKTNNAAAVDMAAAHPECVSDQPWLRAPGTKKKKPAGPSVTHAIDLPGADGLDLFSAFSAAKWKGELAEAKRASKLKMIIKKTLASEDQETKYTSASGQPLVVETFPVNGSTLRLSREFGCPVAVNLYLRFQKECGFLFLLMFVLALPELAGNILRSSRRDDCRALTHTPRGFADVTAANVTGEAGELRCGWSELSIRRNISSSASAYLSPSLGACQEFAAAPNGSEAFIATPSASYCIGNDDNEFDVLGVTSYWLKFVNCIVFFLFLVRLRYVQRHAARTLDRSRWTAADYTVAVKGLDKGGPADDGPSGQARPGLESRVLADLVSEQMGFSRESIAQVEVGRDCADEVREIEKLSRARVAEQELRAKMRLRKSRGQAETTSKMRAKLAKVEEEKREVMAKLEEFRLEPDTATGHAFITFLYERDRNRLISMCKRGGLCGDKRPVWTQSASGGRPYTVEVAPEPDDVLWPNLHLDAAYERKQTAKMMCVTIVLVCAGTVALVATRSLHDAILEDCEGSCAGWFYVPEGLSEEERVAVLNGYRLVTGWIASGVVIVINSLLRKSIQTMAKREGVDTVTEYETSLFAKLSLAYVLNSAFIPMAIGMWYAFRASNRPVNQAWYEAGGVVEQAIFLMISNAVFADIFKILQVGTLLQRYCFAPLVVSQQRLNQLWSPPPMLLGELYAASLKTVSLCLLYAPLWPPAYALTALAMALTFWCTKFAVAKWYMRPPMVSEEMMDKMRSRLGLLMLFHTGVNAIGASAASPSIAEANYQLGAATLPVLAMLILWGVYELLDAPGLLSVIPCLRAFNEAASEDTDGVPYHDDGETLGVEKKMGYEIDAYICPTARTDDRYSLDFLISRVLRDFAEQKDYRASSVVDAPTYYAEPAQSGPPVMTKSKPATKLSPPIMTSTSSTADDHIVLQVRG